MDYSLSQLLLFSEDLVPDLIHELAVDVIDDVEEQADVLVGVGCAGAGVLAGVGLTELC